MPRRMPTLLYILVQAGSYGLLFLALMLALPSGEATVREALGYAALIIPFTALGLLVEEAVRARVEERRTKAPWAVLDGQSELEPPRPFAAILVGAALRAVVTLALARLCGFFRPPTNAHVTPLALGLLLASIVLDRLFQRPSPLRPALKARRERLRNPSPL